MTGIPPHPKLPAAPSGDDSGRRGVVTCRCGHDVPHDPGNGKAFGICPNCAQIVPLPDALLQIDSKIHRHKRIDQLLTAAACALCAFGLLAPRLLESGRSLSLACAVPLILLIGYLKKRRQAAGDLEKTGARLRARLKV